MFKSIFQMAKRLIKGYSYTKHEHCSDPRLLAITEKFKQHKFKEVKDELLSFSTDYKEFAFKSLGGGKRYKSF